MGPSQDSVGQNQGPWRNLESGGGLGRGSGGLGARRGQGALTQPDLTCRATYTCTFPVWMQTGWDVAPPAWRKSFTPCGGGSGSDSSPGGRVNHRPKSGCAQSLPSASLTGTSSKAMPVTLLWGQLCQALLSRKARALVCRPSRAANLRKLQFWMLTGPS